MNLSSSRLTHSKFFVRVIRSILQAFIYGGETTEKQVGLAIQGKFCWNHEQPVDKF